MIYKLLKKPFDLFARGLYRFRYWFSAGVLLLTVVAGYFAANIKLENDFSALLDDDHQVVVNLKKISEIYGGVGVTLLVVRSETFENGRKYVETVVPHLRDHKDIRYVDYRKPVEWFEDRMLLFVNASDLRRIRQRIKRKIDYEREKQKVDIMFGEGFFEGEDPGFNINDIISRYKGRYAEKFGVERLSKEKKDIYYHKKEGPKAVEAMDRIVEIETRRGNVPESQQRKYDSLQAEYLKKSRKGEEVDWQHTFIVIIKPSKPSTDVAYSRYIVDEIDSLTEKVKKSDEDFAGVRVKITGRYKKKIDSLDTMGEDAAIVSLISGGGVLLLLIIFFRSFWPVVLIFSSLVVGIVWTLGFTQIVYGQLNLVTSNLMAILFGLGIDFGIHYMVRYREEREEGGSPRDAFLSMISHTGIPSFTSGLTTAFAFFILLVSGFSAFAEFGAISGVGVLFIFAAMTLFMGPAILILEDFNLLNFTGRRLSLKMPAVIYRKPGLLIGIFVVLIAGSVFMMQRVKFDYYFGKLVNYPHLESLKLDKEANKLFTRSLAPQVVLPENRVHEERILETIPRYIENNRDNPKNYLRSIAGISTFIPDNQKKRLEEIEKIRSLLRRNSKYLPLLEPHLQRDLKQFRSKLDVSRINEHNLPASLRHNFSGVGKHSDRHVVLLFPEVDTTKGRQLLEYAEQIKSLRVDGRELDVAADLLVFAEVLEKIGADGYYILIYVFLGVYVLVVLTFGHFGRALFVLMPLMTGMVIMTGYMGTFNIPVDYFNVIIIPVIIGIGIDSGVHIYHRYFEDRDILLSVRHTGEAVTLSTLTTMTGFGALSFSKNAALASMGNVALTGLVSTFTVSIILLPAMVIVTEKVKKKLAEKKSSD